jgi:gamma-glutamylcyclotransferase (GGCT)/AIG2-like uncharacterized protein YtfP
MATFKLFIYGTLKTTEMEHHLLKGKYRSMRKAVAKGKMYLREDDQIPYITVPGKYILGRGTRDYLRDAALISKVHIPDDFIVVETDSLIQGELFEFDEFEQLMQIIDLFEDYSPGYESDYDRVLFPVKPDDSESFEPVWLYTIAGNHAEDGDKLQKNGIFEGPTEIGSASS